MKTEVIETRTDFTLYEIEQELFKALGAAEIVDATTGEVIAADDSKAREIIESLHLLEARKVDAIVYQLRQSQASIDFLRSEINRIDTKHKAAKKRRESFMSCIFQAMQDNGRNLIEGGTSKLRIQKSPAFVTYKNDKTLEHPDLFLPKEFVVEVPASYKPDGKAILAALKDGKQVEGAELKQNKHLRIY